MRRLFTFLVSFSTLILTSLALYAQVNYSVIDSDPNPTGFVVNSYSNQIVRDSQGNLYVAYGVSTNQATHWYCFIRKSADNGATWGDAVRLESFPDSSSVTSLAIDSKDNLMVGMSFNVGSFFTMSSNGGMSWSSAVQLLDGGWGTWDWMPSLSIDSKDQIHAGFHAQFGWSMPPSNILYTTSSDGITFSAPLDITKIPQQNSNENGAGPANIQIGKNDEIFVMANRSISADSDSYSILMHYSNSQWLDPIVINDDKVYGSGGDFVIDSNGLLHIFFVQIDSATSNRRIFYKVYDPETKKLSEGKAITPVNEHILSVSAGIYQNDVIYIAYDLLDNNTGKSAGVFVRKSEDNFSKTYAVSENIGARSPNLRSHYNNMYNKDKIDIIWIEPDTVAGGEMLVYYDLLNGIKSTGKANIDVFVPYFMNPGQEATIVVRYNNQKEEDITNAAIVLDVPSDFGYLYSSNGGIYKDRDGRPQVFWKLETFKSGSRGTEFVKLLIPWGMPESSGQIVANLVGDNLFSNYDTKKYYNFEEREPLGRKDLSESEITDFLNKNSDVKELLDYSIKLGYVFNKVGQRVDMTGSKSVTILYLMDPKDYTPLFIKKVDAQPVYAEQTQGAVYTRFDTNGGYTTNSSDGSFISFGKWAESHSLTEARCQLNCTINKVPGWIGEAASKTYNMASSGIDCISCAKSKMKEVDACVKCMNSYKDVPGVGYAVDVAQCLKDCLENPNLHICTEDKRECSWSVVGYLSGQDTVFVTYCNKTTGTYDPIDRRLYCAYGEECKNGQCVDKDEDPCNPKTIISPAAELAVCKLDKFKVVPAHDPNAISVEPDGDILPEELLTYTIEYENTGRGAAYEVFIINELDENLDDTTLTINDNGTYSTASRLLKWNIGTLEAGQKGSVSYKVKPRKDLPTGTVISNFAEVHFPSAGEVTPTNILASRINGLAADNKNVSVDMGKSVSIRLTGRDIKGNTPTFKIVSYPKFGSLDISKLPDVEYTAPSNSTGNDRFTYVAISNNVESSIATVAIQIQGEDKTPPFVLSTNPKDKEENVRFGLDTLVDNSLMPEINVVFSEEMNASTIIDTYLLENGARYILLKIEYDNQRRLLTMRPYEPLKASTTYEVILPSSISDIAGNTMGSDYKFSFKTVASRALDVKLNEMNSILDFGKVLVSNKSESKTISLTSIGISGVTISEIKLKQTGEEFKILEDKCSSKVLSPNENCHISVEFSPISIGMKSAEITVASDDDENKSISIALKGEGVESQTPDAGTQDSGTTDGGNTTTEAKDNSGCGCTYIE